MEPGSFEGPSAPPALPDVAVVGAVANPDEALQMHQMRFILMWGMRVQGLAPKPGRAPPTDLAQLLAATGPSDPDPSM